MSHGLRRIDGGVRMIRARPPPYRPNREMPVVHSHPRSHPGSGAVVIADRRRAADPPAVVALGEGGLAPVALRPAGPACMAGADA